MSFVFEQPRSSVGDTFAGGTATFAHIAIAALDNMLYVDNTFAADDAMERAYDERNDEVFRDTGVRPSNPFRERPTQEQLRQSTRRPDFQPGVPAAKQWRDQAVRQWQDQVAQAAGRIPDQSVISRLTRSIDGAAIRIARQSDRKLSELMASRPGLGKYGAALAGGAAGSMRDPINVMSLFLGGGPGAARTITGQIVRTAATEALLNGASEAAMQPMVQAWRKQAGLDNGVDVALRNVGFAAAFGGLFGAGAGALHGIASKLSGRALEAAGAAAADDARIAEPVRRALQGDIAGARETLPEIRDALPAEARGALDQAEQLDHLDTTRPRSADPEIHDVNVSAAHKAIDSDTPPAFKVDQAQVARIVNDIAGDAPAEAARARSLAGFLIDHGGVQDHQGELKAIGATSVSEKFRGRLVRDKGMMLDQAREAAEEAGYIGRPGEAQTTSIADFLSALDEDLRGNQVFARDDQANATRAADAEAERAGLERTVAEIAGHAGPGVDDAIIHQAARLAIDEGMEPFDALESVLTRAEDARAQERISHSIQFQGKLFEGGDHAAVLDEIRRVHDFNPEVDRLIEDLPIEAFGFSRNGRFAMTKKALIEAETGRSGDPLPGWSDAELEAASAARGPEPEAGFFPDPGKADPELEISPAEIQQFAELGIPGDDGRVVTLAAYVDDIKAGEELASIVKACRA